jgi:hypothetical protein
MKEKLETIIARLEVGLTKNSTPTCEWYEGIEYDALDELYTILETL